MAPSNKKNKTYIYSNIFMFMVDICTFNGAELETNYGDTSIDELKLKN